MDIFFDVSYYKKVLKGKQQWICSRYLSKKIRDILPEYRKSNIV